MEEPTAVRMARTKEQMTAGCLDSWMVGSKVNTMGYWRDAETDLRREVLKDYYSELLSD